MTVDENYIGIEGLIIFLAFLALFLFIGYWIRPRTEINQVPLAKPYIPFLGNALAYKKHPDRFLCSQAKILGPLFRINLAGMETYVLSSRATLKQFALAPENVLSSKAAVSDFGFKYTLGERNVYEGSEFHKNVIKSYFTSLTNINSATSRFMESLNNSINIELLTENKRVANVGVSAGGIVATCIDDFMLFSRRVILRSVVEVFLSAHFVKIYQQQHGEKGIDDFVAHFMIFQDLVEESTAAAAVLPLFLAYPTILLKCANKRKILVDKITRVVQRLWTDADSGTLCVTSICL